MNWRKLLGLGAIKRSELPVQDLDDMIQRPIPVKIHGKVREILPISLEKFLEVSNSLAALHKSASTKGVNVKELVDGYHSLFSQIVKPISRADVEAMTQAQVSGMFMLIMGRMQGDNERTLSDAIAQAEKKKTSSLSP